MRFLRLVALTALAVVPLAIAPLAAQAPARHTFALGTKDFLLDGKPFIIRSGEMHPARIPAEHWRHRIQMAKAMGLNTIAAYVFWNYHETREGVFDFRTENRDIARFIRIAQEEGMWVVLRPGPYVCAEWDFGGIPSYLLRDPDLRIRSIYPAYINAAERYMKALAKEIAPLQVSHGGNVLMLQVENEYGSYGNDRNYMKRLAATWRASGIDIPFFTGDGPTQYMLEAGSLPGAAVGLDSGSDDKHWDLAASINPGVPIWSSETYPGWLTHWGEKWQRPSIDETKKEVQWLVDHGKSFNLYVVHGGTNFGFTAGANSGGKGYEPDVTSYDYDAPIDEQGNATPKYHALREILTASRLAGEMVSPIPAPVPVKEIAGLAWTPWASIWNHLPAPITAVHPRPFEYYGQNQGLMLYRTTLVGRHSGKLVITDLHDFATIYLDGQYIGALDRRLGEKSIDLPKVANEHPVLDILVEGMGHINFAQEMIDRKGITDRVTLSGMTLFNWQVYPLPLHDSWITALGKDADVGTRAGIMQRATFTADAPTDVWLDVSALHKATVWVNGHNAGRAWEIGPQTRLYIPRAWVKTGENVVLAVEQMPAR